jgi:hypothetical protein
MKKIILLFLAALSFDAGAGQVGGALGVPVPEALISGSPASLVNTPPFSMVSAAPSVDNTGQDYYLYLNPSYNSTSNVNITDIYLNHVQNGSTTGAQYLMQLNVGGADKFHVDYTGQTVIATNTTITSAGTITHIRCNPVYLSTPSNGRTINANTSPVTLVPSVSTQYLKNISPVSPTINLPTVASDGLRVRIVNGSGVAVTGITWGNGTVDAGVPVTLAAGQALELVYNLTAGSPTNSAAATWYVY